MMKHFFYSIVFSLVTIISTPYNASSIDISEKVDPKVLSYSMSQGFFDALEAGAQLSLLRALKNIDLETLQVVNAALTLDSFDVKLIRSLKKVSLSNVCPLLERAPDKGIFLKELLQAKQNRFQSSKAFMSVRGTVLEPHPSSKERVSKRLSKGLERSVPSVIAAAKDRGLFDTPRRFQAVKTLEALEGMSPEGFREFCARPDFEELKSSPKRLRKVLRGFAG